MRTPRVAFKDEKGDEAYWFPLASKMEEMNPSPWVTVEESEKREACEKDFEYAVWFSSGRDLVEEFAFVGVWPLGRNTWKDFSCRRMWLPILGVEDGMPFPHFGLQRAKGNDDVVIKKGSKPWLARFLGDFREGHY